MSGPIGVDNSEVINIEQERELRRKNQLMYGKDDDEEYGTEQEQEDKNNEILLARLMTAANLDRDKRIAKD